MGSVIYSLWALEPRMALKGSIFAKAYDFPSGLCRRRDQGTFLTAKWVPGLTKMQRGRVDALVPGRRVNRVGNR